jgi:hypothetical protein
VFFFFKITSLAATPFLLLSGSCTSSHWRLQMVLLFIYMVLNSYSPSALNHASFEVGFHFRKQKKIRLMRSQFKKVGGRSTLRFTRKRCTISEWAETLLWKRNQLHFCESLKSLAYWMCLKLRCWGKNFDLKCKNLEGKNARGRDEYFCYSWHITGLSNEGNEMNDAHSTHFWSSTFRVILNNALNYRSFIGVIRLFCSYIYCIDVHCYRMDTCDKIWYYYFYCYYCY